MRDTKILRTKEKCITIPRELYKLHKRVTITADVMFVRGVPLLVTFTREIKFRTAEFLPNRKARIIAKCYKVLML